MADRPFKTLIEARDALTAEILAGKLELSATQSAVLRVLTENTLYKPKDPKDYGFVVTTVPDPLGGDRIPLGVETIARLTGYKERAIKTALADLQDMKLVRRLPRPNWYGGRSVDRIRLDWAMPEGAPDAPSGARRVATGPSIGASGAPSDGGPGASSAPSIGEEGSREEANNNGSSAGGVATVAEGQAQTQSQTQNPGQASAPGSLADDSLAAEIEALIPRYTARYPEWTEPRIRGYYEFQKANLAGKLALLRAGLDAPEDE
jgi:hypothetical protein